MYALSYPLKLFRIYLMGRRGLQRRHVVENTFSEGERIMKLRQIPILLTRIFVVFALLPLGISSHTARAAVSRPGLAFSNPAAQSTLGTAYNAALRNLLDINTVVYDPAVYNGTGLMTNPPGTFVRAGGGYAQPWTRDASINSWNAASLLEPEVATNTLWSVVTRQSNGTLLVQQDNQWWDQVIWIHAAWHHYLVTGDQVFLNNAYQAAVNTLNLRRSNQYNATYGLFRGPSMFNDGIAGYPAPPADATESLGGFVLDYPQTLQMMSLSTNALYYQAYRSAAQMAAALGRPSTEIDPLNSSATSLATAINQRLWIPSAGTYGYFLHNSGAVDPSEEGTGLSLVILFGIADAARAASILQRAHIQPHGIVDVYPNFARYSDAQPGRHNNIVWPMVQGYWATAASKYGNEIVFAREVANLARLANSSAGNFYEIYNAQTGAVDGGWQTGSHWGSQPDQTWSATAYLRMIYNGLFGMNFTTGGLQFQPFLPSGWGDVTLSGVRYRGMTLNISLHGAGNVISSFKLDGATTANYSVPASLTGTHTIDITLTGSNILQAEQAARAGTAGINTDHAGYTGTGFVDGYGTAGATTTFTVNAPAAGSYSLSLRYANGTGAARTVSLYVNGTRLRQTSLPALANWNVWSLANETVTLNAGNNTVAFRYDTGDSGNVNLDALILNWSTAAGVTFYQDADYAGAASGAKVQGDYAALPADVPNDWMSSLKVPAGWTVQAYSEGNFGGTLCTFTADTAFVGTGCNDAMSSFRIRTAGSPTLTPTRTPTRTPTPAGPTFTPTRTPTRTNTPVGPTATRTRTPTPVSPTGVTFYQDANYGGLASGMKAKGDYATMPADVPNDWMSSLRVPAGWIVDAYANGNFGGAVCTYTADTSWVGAACNDVMSSFRIR
jgi:hypothetical protein